MGISLQKGQKIDLTKGGGGGLRQVMVGLGWDEAQPSSGGGFLKNFSGAGLLRPLTVTHLRFFAEQTGRLSQMISGSVVFILAI